MRTANNGTSSHLRIQSGSWWLLVPGWIGYYCDRYWCSKIQVDCSLPMSFYLNNGCRSIDFYTESRVILSTIISETNRPNFSPIQSAYILITASFSGLTLSPDCPLGKRVVWLSMFWLLLWVICLLLLSKQLHEKCRNIISSVIIRDLKKSRVGESIQEVTNFKQVMTTRHTRPILPDYGFSRVRYWAHWAIPTVGKTE